MLEITDQVVSKHSLLTNQFCDTIPRRSYRPCVFRGALVCLFFRNSLNPFSFFLTSIVKRYRFTAFLLALLQAVSEQFHCLVM